MFQQLPLLLLSFVLEKLEIIETADDLLNIRELRNQIAHEYQEKELKELFIDVLRYTPKLKTITGMLKKYIQNTLDGPGMLTTPTEYSFFPGTKYLPNFLKNLKQTVATSACLQAG